MDIINILFSFNGRVPRRIYWITEFVVLAILIIPQYTIFEKNTAEAENFEIVAMLILLWPMLAVQAKRWHDRNKSAYWLLINFVPFIGPIWGLIENGFLGGTPGDNNYGPEPLYVDDNET